MASSHTLSFIGDMTNYDERLKTFNEGWKYHNVTPEKMAGAGFYFMGKDDYVRCMLCSLQFNHWKLGDDPLLEHKKKSPSCYFIKGYPGIDLQMKKDDCKKNVASLEGRLQTFKKCVNKLKYEIQVYSEAGYYYTGDGKNNHMKTFCCNLIRNNSEESDDDPWTEHVKLFPNCSYVTLNQSLDIDCPATKFQRRILNQESSIPGLSNFRSNLENALEKTRGQYENVPEHFINEFMCLGYQIAIKQGNSSSFCDICYTYRTHKVVMSCGHHNNVCECVGISEVACFLCNKMETLNEWIVDVYNRVRPSRLPCITTLGASQLDTKLYPTSPLTSKPVTQSGSSTPHEQQQSFVTSTFEMNDVASFNNRLRTFDKRWKLKYLAPEIMADAGFYYMGQQEVVHCMSCSQQFDHWKPGDNPLEVHKNKSPQCQFLKGYTGLDLRQGEGPFDKNLATFAGRLKTFEMCKKPLKHDIRALCEAGFYFTGDGDRVSYLTTFCCHIYIVAFNKEPWTEHYNCSPKCWYIILNRQVGGVNEASGIQIETRNQVNTVAIPGPSNSPASLQNVETQQSECLVAASDSHIEKPRYNVNSSISLKASKVIDGSVICKTCFKEEINTVLIPCGHITICSNCALLSKYCPDCKQLFTIASRVSIKAEKSNSELDYDYDDLDDLDGLDDIDDDLEDVLDDDLEGLDELDYYDPRDPDPENEFDYSDYSDDPHAGWSLHSSPSDSYSLSPPTVPNCNNLEVQTANNPILMYNTLLDDASNNKLDMTVYENRLKSYDVKWVLKHITPVQMAKAGFYFLGRQDNVRCTFCNEEFSYWSKDEIPFLEHFERCPSCPFFQESQAYDLIQLERSPRYHSYVHFETRLNTFENCQTKRIKDDSINFSAAGLFFNDDHMIETMTCFYCGVCFRDWTDENEPWKEHARWSPHCDYLLSCRGKKYVENVLGLPSQTRKLNMTTLSEIVSNANALANPDRTNMNTDTKRELNTPNTAMQINGTLLPESNSNDPQQQVTSSTSEDLLCKICFKENIRMAFLPCGHAIACTECAGTINSCAICRDMFDVALDVIICTDNGKNKQPNDEPLNALICKVCAINEMSTVFIPCNHIYACQKCAIGMRQCPACFQEIVSSKGVYL